MPPELADTLSSAFGGSSDGLKGLRFDIPRSIDLKPTRTLRFTTDEGTWISLDVSPDGDDKAAGSAAAPFRSLERAQAAVRAANAHQDVTVIVHGGVWTRIEPLIFTAKDGGQNGFGVRWRGADDARPLIRAWLWFAAFLVFAVV